MSQSKIYSLDKAHTALVCSLSSEFFWREYLFFEVTGLPLPISRGGKMAQLEINLDLKRPQKYATTTYLKKRRLCN